MVVKLGEALQLPLDARNQMLTHAGFAVRYKGRDWSDAEMAPVRLAIERTLANHMPFPGLAIDRRWQGTVYAWLSIAGFGVVLFTYLGIGLLMQSNHPLE